MTLRERKTEGFKPILVSPVRFTQDLHKMTNKSQIYDDVITELLEQGDKN